jgi:hypothetical protein
VVDPQPCDFCGAPVIWTPEQVQLDLSLKLRGSPFCTGLGVMCDACDDKQIASAIADLEREDARAAAEDDDYDDYDDGEIGCVNCDAGWRHGCCDDLCRGSNESQDCDSPRRCLTCNPHGEVL